MHATIWGNRALTDLNTLVDLPSGVTFNYCREIGNGGHIVVTGSDNYYYLLTPDVPEPSGFVSVLSAIFGMAAFGSKRKKK